MKTLFTILALVASMASAPGRVQEAPAVTGDEDWQRIFADEVTSSFRVSADPKQLKAGEEAVLLVEFRLHSGWYLEGPRSENTPLRLELADDRYFELMDVPSGDGGKIVHDELLEKDVEKFFDAAKFRQTLRVRGDAPSGEHVAELRLKGQSCREGSCRMLPRGTGVSIAFQVEADAAAAAAEVERRAAAASETGAIVEGSSQSPLAFLLACFLGGLAMLLLPCIWPMIPITVSFFVKQAEQKKGNSTLMALLYGFGIIATYTAIGFMTSFWLPPKVAQDLATGGVLNLFLGVLFIVLALSFFGMFDLQMPAFITNRVNTAAYGKSHGFVVGTLLLGVVFTVTSFACSAPVMANIWAFGLRTGDKWMVPLGMCVAAIAVSIPFVILAIFPSLLKAMPKSGGWMNTFKVTLGFIELAAALKFLSNADMKWNLELLTWPIFMCAWIMISLALMLYLFGRLRLPHDDPDAPVSPVRMMFGLSVGVLAFVLMVGLFLGEPMPQPITAFAPPKYYGRPHVSELPWIEEWEEVERVAAQKQRPIFIDFTGVNCTNCRLVEEAVFPRVEETLEKFVLARLFTDRGALQAEYDEMKNRFGSYDLPYYVILMPDGKTKIGSQVYTTDWNEFEKFLHDGLDRFEREWRTPVDRTDNIAQGAATPEEVDPEPEEAIWYTDLEEARAVARKKKKRLFLDFTGKYCRPCKIMEKKVFPEVEAQLRNYVLVKLVVDLPEEPASVAKKAYLESINGGKSQVPVYVIEDAAGKSHAKVEGLQEVGVFAAFLESGLGS